MERKIDVWENILLLYLGMILTDANWFEVIRDDISADDPVKIRCGKILNPND